MDHLIRMTVEQLHEMHSLTGGQYSFYLHCFYDKEINYLTCSQSFFDIFSVDPSKK